MPKGVYERKPRGSYKKSLDAIKVNYDTAPVVEETYEEIAARIAERFEILQVLTEACTIGNARSLIVSGPPGLGKSFTVEEHLANWDANALNHIIVKGYVRATGLVKLLYQFREAGQVIVFDDADSIFADDIALNLLKAVCDTTERRRVSWLSEGKLIDDETAEVIPRSFDFNGTIIFITNMDFDALIERGHKLAPHLEALVSRSHYIDLAMKSRRDYLVRIKQVIEAGLLNDLNWAERIQVVNFIEANHAKLRELSLRVAIKIGALRKTNPANWERIAKITCCR